MGDIVSESTGDFISVRLGDFVGIRTIAMLVVRFYATHVGLTGGLLTIAAMLIAAHWYDRRPKG